MLKIDTKGELPAFVENLQQGKKMNNNQFKAGVSDTKQVIWVQCMALKDNHTLRGEFQSAFGAEYKGDYRSYHIPLSVGIDNVKNFFTARNFFEITGQSGGGSNSGYQNSSNNNSGGGNQNYQQNNQQNSNSYNNSSNQGGGGNSSNSKPPAPNKIWPHDGRVFVKVAQFGSDQNLKDRFLNLIRSNGGEPAYEKKVWSFQKLDTLNIYDIQAFLKDNGVEVEIGGKKKSQDGNNSSNSNSANNNTSGGSNINISVGDCANVMGTLSDIVTKVRNGGGNITVTFTV